MNRNKYKLMKTIQFFNEILSHCALQSKVHLSKFQENFESASFEEASDFSATTLVCICALRPYIW